ncbi:MAG: DUF3152 domain-containing protein [Candidatus Saccharimonadales bacterium]
MKHLSYVTGITGSLVLIVTVVWVTHLSAIESDGHCDSKVSAWCVGPRLMPIIDAVAGATVPKLATPDWLAPVAPITPQSVTYSLSTRGTITADLAEFRSVVAATLADSRGWTRLGVSFREVESGGQFTVFLSEASQLTTFSATACDTTYSCNVGRAVIINQDRWLNATPSWTSGGGDLASYRQMVINHETGHWLGHGHRSCTAVGQAAPVMQQQSMDLQGCSPNAWPLTGELYSPTLGIRS